MADIIKIFGQRRLFLEKFLDVQENFILLCYDIKNKECAAQQDGGEKECLFRLYLTDTN